MPNKIDKSNDLLVDSESGVSERLVTNLLSTELTAFCRITVYSKPQRQVPVLTDGDICEVASKLPMCT